MNLNKKKILILFSSNYVGGAEKNLMKLSSRDNNSKNCEYFLYTFQNPNKLIKLFSSTTSNYFTFYSRFKFFNIIFVIYTIYKYKFNFLYISGFRYSVYLRLIKIIIPKTKIVIAQRWNPDSKSLLDIILRFTEQFFWFFTHGYISNSKAANNTLSRIVKNKNKLHTIYNGIAITPINKSIKKKYDICVLAHISTRKGHLNFIEKIYEIKKIIPKIKVIFIGTNLLEKKIEKSIKYFNLSDNIILTGYQTKVENFLLESKILVLPSKLGEGLPTAIIEGLSKKLPIVAYDIDGNKEVIIDNFNGFLVDKNKDNMIEKILRLLQDDEYYNFLKKNSQIYLLKEFTNHFFYTKHNDYFENA